MLPVILLYQMLPRDVLSPFFTNCGTAGLLQSLTLKGYALPPMRKAPLFLK